MGRGLERHRERVAYLDTHVAIRLAQGDAKILSPSTLRRIGPVGLLVSPMVVLEMEYLYEIRRSRLTADEVMIKLRGETTVQICSLPFAEIAQAALQEKWTRDPFDRIIVANAKANGFAWLITDDRRIHAHYQRALD